MPLIMNEMGEFVDREPPPKYMVFGTSEISGGYQPRECDVCGRKFKPTSPTQRRCSKECTNAAKAKAKKRRAACKH